MTPDQVDTVVADVGEVLYDAIEQSGLSQGELADLAGCHRTTVISALKVGNLRLSTLVRIAHALGFEARVYLHRRPSPRTPFE